MAANYICTPTVIPMCLPSYLKGRPCVTSSTLIEISCDTPGVLIFYTVNGRPPDPLGAWQMHDVTWPYDGPFTLDCSSRDGGGALRTVRALATDAAVVKRSAIVTKIFHVMPVEGDEKSGGGSEGRHLSTRKRANHSTTRKAVTGSAQPQISPTSSTPRTPEVPALTEANNPRTATQGSGPSKWQRLASLSRSRQRIVDHVFRSSRKTSIAPAMPPSDSGTTDELPVSWEQPRDLDDLALPTGDVTTQSIRRANLRLDFQTVRETKVEGLVDDDDKGTYKLDDSSDSDSADFDVSEELPDHLIDSDQFRNEATVEDHLVPNDNDTRESERSSTAGDKSYTRRHVRFASQVLVDSTELPTDKQSPENRFENLSDEVDSFNEMVNRSRKQISMVSRESQTANDSADAVYTALIMGTDCGVQCQMELNFGDNRQEKVAVYERPEIECADQACQTNDIEYTILMSVATQTEEIDDSASTTVSQSVEMVSIGVGHSVTTEFKFSQTTAMPGSRLLDKAVQTESRVAAVFDDDDEEGGRRPRRRAREGVRVSPGRGYWRQQIDHLTKELKTQADNSLEFRSMISEPRMTGIKRVVVHEGLDEMVLVVNVGLQYHPEWCCKS